MFTGCGSSGLVGSGEGENFAAVCREGRNGIAYRDSAVGSDSVSNGRIAVLRVEGRAGSGVGSSGELHRDLTAVLNNHVACCDVSGDVSVAESYSGGDGYRIRRINVVSNGGGLSKSRDLASRDHNGCNDDC